MSNPFPERVNMTDDNDGVDGVDLDSGVLQFADSLDDRGLEDVLDEGLTVPERLWEKEHYGITAREAAEPEPLSGRLARELPDVAPGEGDGLGDLVGSDGEALDHEVGDVRVGRLVDVPPAGEYDDFQYLIATAGRRDGGAASAEEAAIHLVEVEGERFVDDAISPDRSA